MSALTDSLAALATQAENDILNLAELASGQWFQQAFTTFSQSHKAFCDAVVSAIGAIEPAAQVSDSAAIYAASASPSSSSSGSSSAGSVSVSGSTSSAS